MNASLQKVVLLATIITVVSGQVFYPRRSYGGHLEYQENPYIRFPQQAYYQSNYRLPLNNNDQQGSSVQATVSKVTTSTTTSEGRPTGESAAPLDDVVTILAAKENEPVSAEEQAGPIDDDKYAIGTRGNFGSTKTQSPSQNSKTPALPYPVSGYQFDKIEDSEGNKQGPSSSPALSVAKANNRFTLSMLNIVKSSGGNYVFSPFSLASIMAMLMAGADGTTKQEIQETLSFPENQDTLYKGFELLHKNLNKSPNDTSFVSSNRLFIQEGIDLKEEFQRILKEKFHAPAQQIDFDAEDATRKINKIVAEDTKQEIPNLIDAGILNNKTRLVALNALYFKGGWENAFHGRATKTREFYKNGVDKVDVDMMNTEEYFKVANIDFLDAKAVVLPYVGGETEMIILVPNKLTGLGVVEEAFESRLDAYSEIISRLNQKPKNIVLHLPRFSLQSNFDLQRTLNQLGIRKAFLEYQADFSKITGKDLFLSKIVQKAFINVNEAGTHAGAASYGAVFTPLSIGPTIEDTITVNRPFMGFIRNVKTNLILFGFRKVE